MDASTVTRRPAAGQPRNVDRGPWIQTYTGRRFYLFDPQPEDVDPLDIGHALSMLCRYGGHLRAFYSVAEHSVHVAHSVPAEHALAGLLHDGTEAYIGDMVAPLKQAMPDYQQVEQRIWQAVAVRFQLPNDGQLPWTVVDADLRIRHDETAALPPAASGFPAGKPLGVTIHSWKPADAERAWLDLYHHLTQECAR